MEVADSPAGVALERKPQFAGLRLRALGIDPCEATFARRGFFSSNAARRSHLELIGDWFVRGYNAAIRAADPTRTAGELSAIPRDFAGFAFEGAAMGMALLDLITPWTGDRFRRFSSGDGRPHAYMVHVGAGWALARTSRHLVWRLGERDPLLKWLALDGYGFHAGYFHPRTAIHAQRAPRGLRGVARNVFDQGLGRAIWFACGADPAAVITTIGNFPASRRPDLWSGVGLATAYAGAADEADLVALATAAGAYWVELGQGAAFAAKARSRAGSPAPQTELACRVYCGADAATAAAWTDEALPTPSPGDQGQAYQQWRAAIRELVTANMAERRT